jgi:hypothetical protein
VGERVRGQQMTELVVNVGLRDRHDREEGQPHGEGRHDDGQDRSRAMACQPAERALERPEPSRAEAWPYERDEHDRNNQGNFEQPGWQGSPRQTAG